MGVLTGGCIANLHADTTAGFLETEISSLNHSVVGEGAGRKEGGGGGGGGGGEDSAIGL